MDLNIGGKGNHTNYLHLKGAKVTLSGKLGDGYDNISGKRGCD